MPGFLSWQTGVSFALGASFSLLAAAIAYRNCDQAAVSPNRARRLPKSKPKIDVGPEYEDPFRENDDGDLRKAMIDLNESAMAEFRRRLERGSSWIDLSNLFVRWSHLYPSARHRLLQKRSLQSPECRGSRPEKSIPVNLLSVPQAKLEILRPLASEVTTLLRQYTEEEQELSGDDISSVLSKALKNGEVIWNNFARAVVQLNDRIVVKLGPSLTSTDADMTAYIQQHSTDIPVPTPLGVLSFGRKTFHFMRLIDGRPLDKLWPELTDDEKSSVRDQLDFIMEKLRSLPPPNQFLGGGTPPQCVDCRMSIRKSPSCIESEAQFNEFLLSGDMIPGVKGLVEFIKLGLREDHRFVLTHGDLHPRNIMAVKAEEGGIQVTGLVDWESGGVYPEHWEFVKSLNTVYPIRLGDWPFYLPLKGIGKYFGEYAVDCLVNRCVI